ncbi:heat shock factor protein 2 isoform X1 [Rattus norvegicus]|uniref:Heat shock transcription factor 2 n=2 Tax=Rattus norvegicus TaxID=10116 RepID=A0ABK0L2J2_RAT|nr:heat shock factor protein 2 isoform X1 [Rattus norvegicus]|eukprot:XP_006256567.1 PREDICTED: heat shock factor protein 2 isoform X1 [Rattus norvegicus]
MKQSSNVPAFLSKLWTLVEETHTNEFITWSQNGQSFLVLDEQRFAKEILPKYFKHNNMASFVRQLNMYGFRKVVHIESGIVKQERDGPVEFQHPHFKQGQDDLLENIKRKVSSSKPEENKIRQEDLTKIISSAQKVQIKQETIESRLSELKSENESLWKEVSELRAKHAQQQQVIRKIVQFIVTLVQNNQLVSLKRKRPLLLNTNGAPKKNLFQHIVKEPTDNHHHKVPHSRTEGLKSRERISDDIIIYDVTEDNVDEENIPVIPETNEDVVVDPSSQYPDIVIVEDDNEDEYAPVIQSGEQSEPARVGSASSSSPLMSSAVQLNGSSNLTSEDPVTMMDSILNDNINLLGKVELLDYLDSIDCSLEDFQAMLSGRQFSIDPDLLVDLFTSSVQMNPTDYINNTKSENKGLEATKNSVVQQVSEEGRKSKSKPDKQLIQYTAFPLLAFLDGNPASAVEQGTTTASSEVVPSVDKPIEVDELLDSNLDQEPTQSKLVRLEPLTEAEASEATLFYLCELAPAPLDSDMPLLDS